MESGNLNFLEPTGPVQACNGTALPFFSNIKDGDAEDVNGGDNSSDYDYDDDDNNDDDDDDDDTNNFTHHTQPNPIST